MKKWILALAVATLATGAEASTVGFSFSMLTSEAARVANGVTNPGNGIVSNVAQPNTPYVLLTNTSTAAGVGIEDVTFTISYVSTPATVLDFSIREVVYNNSGSTFTYTQVLPATPDTNGNPTAPFSSQLQYTFSAGFDGTDRFSSFIDFDPGSPSAALFQTILASGTVTVNYSNGQTLTATYGNPVTPSPADTYTVSASATEDTGGSGAPVPLPASVWSGLGLIGAVVVSRARRRFA